MQSSRKSTKISQKKNKSPQNYIPNRLFITLDQLRGQGEWKGRWDRQKSGQRENCGFAFERDEGKFPSWYSSVKNTEVTLLSQGPSHQALNKCYSVCWHCTLFGMGVVKMDMDKNNKGKKGGKKHFCRFSPCLHLLLSVVIMKSHLHCGHKRCLF